MKTIKVWAKKVENGYLIPSGILQDYSDDKLLLEVKVKKDNKKPEDIHNDYKHLSDNGIWERYKAKDENKESSRLTDHEIDQVSEEFGLMAESIEDLLRL